MKNITLTFTEYEALVLFDWVGKFNNQDHSTLFEDQAEQRVLWSIEARLEKVISCVFADEYLEILAYAREKVRDKDE